MTTTKSLETMDVQIFRIYLAHPKPTYNTLYELNCIEKIKELHPGCEIVNPRDIPIEEKDKNPKNYAEFMRQMNKYYFPAIETCSLMMVAKTGSGKISPGVQKEIPYGQSKNILVEYLDIPFPGDNKPTLTCYYCGIQFVVDHEDIAPEEEWEEHNRAATSECSMKDPDDTWRDSCSHCNGIDPCFGCEYIEKCISGHMGGNETIDDDKCQVQRY